MHRTMFFPSQRDLVAARSIHGALPINITTRVVPADRSKFDALATYWTSLRQGDVSNFGGTFTFFLDGSVINQKVNHTGQFYFTPGSGEHILSVVGVDPGGSILAFHEHVINGFTDNNCEPFPTSNSTQHASSLWNADQVFVPRNAMLDPVAPNEHRGAPDRVAVCVAGQLRTFFTCGGEKNLHDSIVRGIGHAHVDIFFDVSDGCWPPRDGRGGKPASGQNKEQKCYSITEVNRTLWQQPYRHD